MVEVFIEAIVNAIGHLAWPVVLLVMCLVFRKPLNTLLLSVSRLRYKEFEVFFREKVKQIAGEVSAELPAGDQPRLPAETTDTQAPDVTKSVDITEQVDQIASVYPVGAVPVAWDAVEASLMATAQRVDLPSAQKPSPSSIQVLTELQSRGFISNQQLIVFERMRNLRNQVTHELLPDYAIAEEDAREYGRLAQSVIGELERIGSDSTNH
jgi:hypothetical protein